MRVLIVDDDRVDRMNVIRAIRKKDLQCNITEAQTVEEGLERFFEENFDVVLLDYRLPERNGIEMLMELRNKQEVGTAIVMLSNSEDEELTLDCIRAGAHDFMLKSDITPMRLRRVMLNAKTRFQLERELNKSYKTVKQLAERDSLTGLANRYLFEENLRAQIASCRRSGDKVALLLIDIDHFKYINDQHGHYVGDIVLKKLAQRLENCFREVDLLARVGGDEFALIASQLKSTLSVSHVSQRVIDILEAPFTLNGAEVYISVSIGIVIYPDTGESAEELFKYADIAMYRAKSLGRKQACFFEESMQKEFLKRYQIENNLREAIEKDQFYMHYQPIFETQSLSLKGFEALIRWELNGKLQSPAEFIPIAEESRLIVKIGRKVVEQSVCQLARLSSYYSDELSMSINLSAIQLDDAHLVGFIEDCLQRNNIDPERINFELTETALIETTENTVNMIHRISALGCGIALDDFGTGFSSISHLLEFPISIVKIDRSLMAGQPDKDKSVPLIRGLASMAHSLGLDIVAEGIETNENLELCRELGIQHLQGYLLSKPLDAAQAEQFLKNKKTGKTEPN